VGKLESALRSKTPGCGDDKKTRMIDLRSLQYARCRRISVNGKDTAFSKLFEASAILLDYGKGQAGTADFNACPPAGAGG
jgi:hypothetical protein